MSIKNSFFFLKSKVIVLLLSEILHKHSRVEENFQHNGTEENFSGDNPIKIEKFLSPVIRKIENFSIAIENFPLSKNFFCGCSYFTCIWKLSENLEGNFFVIYAKRFKFQIYKFQENSRVLL